MLHGPQDASAGGIDLRLSGWALIGPFVPRLRDGEENTYDEGSRIRPRSQEYDRQVGDGGRTILPRAKSALGAGSRYSHVGGVPPSPYLARFLMPFRRHAVRRSS